MKVNTTVTLDATFYGLAKQKRINISSICNDALRSILEIEGGVDAQIEQVNFEIEELEKKLLSAKTVLATFLSAKNAQTDQEKSAYMEQARAIYQAERVHGKNRWL